MTLSLYGVLLYLLKEKRGLTVTKERREFLITCFENFNKNDKRKIFAFLVQANVYDDEHSSMFDLLLIVTEYMLKHDKEAVEITNELLASD